MSATDSCLCGSNAQQHNMENVPFSVSDTSFLESVIDAARGPQLELLDIHSCELNPMPSTAKCNKYDTISHHQELPVGGSIDEGYFGFYSADHPRSHPSLRGSSVGSNEILQSSQVHNNFHSVNGFYTGEVSPALASPADISLCDQLSQGSLPYPQSGISSWGISSGTGRVIHADANIYPPTMTPPPIQQPISPSWSPNSSGYYSIPSPGLEVNTFQDPIDTSCSSSNPQIPNWNITPSWNLPMKPCPGKPYWEQMRMMASGVHNSNLCTMGYQKMWGENKENHPQLYVNNVHHPINQDTDGGDNTIGNYPMPKPKAPFMEMIAKSLISAPDKKLILADIYKYVLETYPYYRSARKTWRNAIRHNLSVNACFVKCGRSNTGRGHFWAIHPACIDMFSKGDFRRHHARRIAQHSPSSAASSFIQNEGQFHPIDTTNRGHLNRRVVNQQVDSYHGMVYPIRKNMVL